MNKNEEIKWINPVNLMSIDYTDRFMVHKIKDYFLKVIGLEINTFLISKDSLNITKSMNKGVIALDYESTAQQISKTYPFDPVLSIIKDNEAPTLRCFIDGNLVKEISLDNWLSDEKVFDKDYISKKAALEFKSLLDGRFDGFKEKWNDEIFYNQKIDFNKIIKDGDEDGTIKLLKHLTLAINNGDQRDLSAIFKAGVPLGVLLYILDDFYTLGDFDFDLDKIMSASYENPDTFYFPGDESEYNPQIIRLFKVFKSAREMKDILADTETPVKPKRIQI